jgi:8-oxo-dGTP pyrophosphatase MutT (NUDIX family)
LIKEISCGAIIYRVENDEPVFIIIHSKRNKEWGFPKGHIEKGETELEAAKREIIEETGIENLKFNDNFRSESSYNICIGQSAPEMRIKHCVLFLAETHDETYTFDREEIDEIKCLAFEEALKLLKYDNQKEALNSAYNKIKNKQEE